MRQQTSVTNQSPNYFSPAIFVTIKVQEMRVIPIVKGKRGKRIKGTNYEYYASTPTQILLYHIVS
jgi:hypothetical protein